MNAFRALGRGVVPEAESAWLFKIAENVCPLTPSLLLAARPGREPERLRGHRGGRSRPSRHRDELIGIEDALASMPEQQRRAILLREWQGLSYREIGEELEVSQSAVETLIFRARRSLAQGLEQPDLAKKPRRKGLRRALHAIDLGTIAAAAKTVLAGSAAAKATAAAVAVTAAATAATVTPSSRAMRLLPRTFRPRARRRAGRRRGRSCRGLVPRAGRGTAGDDDPHAGSQRAVAATNSVARPSPLPLRAQRQSPQLRRPRPRLRLPAQRRPGRPRSRPRSSPPHPPTAASPVHVPVPSPPGAPSHEQPQPIVIVKSHDQPPAPVVEPPTLLPVPIAPVLTVDPHHVEAAPIPEPFVAAPPVTVDPVLDPHG